MNNSNIDERPLQVRIMECFYTQLKIKKGLEAWDIESPIIGYKPNGLVEIRYHLRPFFACDAGIEHETLVIDYKTDGAMLNIPKPLKQVQSAYSN